MGARGTMRKFFNSLYHPCVPLYSGRFKIKGFTMRDTYLFYAKRTPIGKFAGSLSSVRVDDLLAELFKGAVSSINFDPKEIDDVIVGCANQAGEDNRNLARMSLLLAGLPYEVPGTTINRLCGSSLDAIIDGWGRIQCGVADCLLIGGAESMSRAPYVMSKAQTPFERTQQTWDTSIGWRFPNKKMKEMFPLYGMGETAEEVASLHKISREEQDEFAFNSHKKATAAIEAGQFKNEIQTIEVKRRKDSFVFDTDEGPRGRHFPRENLASFGRLLEKGGSVTAGNSSSINDGAACLFMGSDEFIKKHKLTPLVKMTGAGVRGLHPNTMGLGPVHAVRTLCERYSKKSE